MVMAAQRWSFSPLQFAEIRTGAEPMRKSWYLPSVLILALLAIGAGGSGLRLLSPERGFGIFLAGVVLAVLSMPVFAGAAAFASATGRPWRSSAVRAAVVPLLSVLVILVPNLPRVNPPIHDITTDPQDALPLRPEIDQLRSDEPDRAWVLEQQRQHYADLVPLELPLPPDQAFSAVLAAAERMPRWEVTAQDAPAGRVEAIARSRLFGFLDDVLIRVQASGAGSRIDMRSRSRFGGGDLGANAARIRAFFAELQAVAAQRGGAAAQG
jgi:uncharacterized protein (DUF1499 family)